MASAQSTQSDNDIRHSNQQSLSFHALTFQFDIIHWVTLHFHCFTSISDRYIISGIDIIINISARSYYREHENIPLKYIHSVFVSPRCEWLVRLCHSRINIEECCTHPTTDFRSECSNLVLSHFIQFFLILNIFNLNRNNWENSKFDDYEKWWLRAWIWKIIRDLVGTWRAQALLLPMG